MSLKELCNDLIIVVSLVGYNAVRYRNKHMYPYTKFHRKHGEFNIALLVGNCLHLLKLNLRLFQK